MKEERTELPRELEIDNYIMAGCALLAPLWWLAMIWHDAREPRTGKWRFPTIPRVLEMNVPPGSSAGGAEDYLHRVGVGTAFVSGRWLLEGGVIMLYQTFLVPGRSFEWGEYCALRLLKGDPVPPRWASGINGGSLEMVLSSFFCGIMGRHEEMIGQRVRRKKKRDVLKRAVSWLDERGE